MMDTLMWLNEPYEDRIKAILQLQRYRNVFLDKVARIGTFFSDEEFYLTLFPFLYWGPLCDPLLASNLCVCIGLGLPIGNIFKNIFCVRRPTSPPVWQYHTSNEEHEFAFPSTHAILASAVSLQVVIHHLFNYDYAHPLVALIGSLLFVFIWSLLVSLSRVYLGAHSFQDIAFGAFIGILFGITLSLSLQFFNDTLINGSLFIKLISLACVLAVLHFHPINKSSKLNFHLSEGTFDYSAPVLGLAYAGLISRTWYHSQSAYCINSYDMLLFIRFLVGIPFTVFFYTLTKKTLPILIEPLLKYLNIKAHYIPYSEYARYLTHNIKEYTHLTHNGCIVNGTEGGGSVEKNQNPELLLAWVRIYTKFLLYVVLTYLVAVIVPVYSGIYFD